MHMEHREGGRDMSREQEKSLAKSLEGLQMTVSARVEQLPFEGLKQKDQDSKEKIIKQMESKLIRQIDRAQIFEESLEGSGIDVINAKLKEKAKQIDHQYKSKLASHDFYHLDVEDSEGEYKELIVVNDFLDQIKMIKDSPFYFRTGGPDSRKLARSPSGLN